MIHFHQERALKTRVAHTCAQCGQAISKGADAVHSKGNWDSHFYGYYTHIECNAAARAYAQKMSLYDEDWPWFQHDHLGFDIGDWKWMAAEYPIVADRLGWSGKLKELLADDDAALAKETAPHG